MKRTTKYVGLDVHQAMTVATVRGEGGRVIARSVIETSDGSIREFLSAMAGSVHVAFEEGTQAQWLSRAFVLELFETDRAKFFVVFFLSGDGSNLSWERAQGSPSRPPHTRVSGATSTSPCCASKLIIVRAMNMPRETAYSGGLSMSTRSGTPFDVTTTTCRRVPGS